MTRRRWPTLPLVGAVLLVAACSQDRSPLTAPEESQEAAVQADQQTPRDLIPNEYIVVFRRDVADAPGLARELEGRHGLTVRHTYQYALKGFSAVVPERAVDALRANPNVAFLEQNAYFHLTAVAAPSNLSATAASESQINLSWADNSSNEQLFEVHRSLDGPTGTFEFLSRERRNSTSFVDSGLSAGTEYCYKVRAGSLREGYSEFSNVDCATTQGGGTPTVPAAPSGLAAQATGTSTIDLSWTDNANDETGFRVERALGQGGTFAAIATPGANETSYGDSGLQENTEYCYRVFAVNGVGDSDPSNVDCATTQSGGTPTVPAAPSGLAAQATGTSTIDLSWTDNANDETGFRVERALGQGGTFAAIATPGANETSYGDSGLQENTEYCYRVFAVNGVGDSDPSNVDCATTQSAPPPGECPDTGNHDDLTQSGLYGITKVKANLNPTWKGTQNGGSCAIQAWYFGLDSGVDSDHPDLNVVEIRSFLTDGSTGEDENGHGTHTAGTAAAKDGNGGVVGVAPGARIHGFQVCNAGGSCPIDAIVAGVDEVTARKLGNSGQPMVANMSLGGGISESIDLAVRESVNTGVVYALSAGNGKWGFCFRPADAQGASPARVGDDAINASNGSDGDTRQVNGAITTTSSDQNDADVNCNYGNPVTVAAPGEGILSTYLNGGTATLSGTSMAAPHAAGAALLYLQNNPSATPTQVEQAIVNDLDPWSTNDQPNADGRLDAEGL